MISKPLYNTNLEYSLVWWYTVIIALIEPSSNEQESTWKLTPDDSISSTHLQGFTLRVTTRSIFAHMSKGIHNIRRKYDYTPNQKVRKYICQRYIDHAASHWHHWMDQHQTRHSVTWKGQLEAQTYLALDNLKNTHNQRGHKCDITLLWKTQRWLISD